MFSCLNENRHLGGSEVNIFPLPLRAGKACEAHLQGDSVNKAEGEDREGGLLHMLHQLLAPACHQMSNTTGSNKTVITSQHGRTEEPAFAFALLAQNPA